MKKNVVLFIILCLSGLQAQTQKKLPQKSIEPVVKKENLKPKKQEENFYLGDYIDLIETITKTSIGFKMDEKKEILNVKFYGYFYEIEEKYGSEFIYKKRYDNIDWSKLKDVTYFPSSNQLYYTIVVEFNENKIINSMTGYYRNKINSSRFEYTNTIYINIPSANKDRIPYLVKAIKEMASYFVKKGNLYNSAKLVVSELTDKPNFVETVNYINKYLEDAYKETSYKDFISCNTVHFKSCKAFVYIKHGKLYLNSTFTREQHSSYRNIDSEIPYTYDIEINDVEDIKIAWGEGFEGGCLQSGLWFVKQGQNQAVMHLPLWITAYDSTSAQSLKDNEIYKAFDNLRKIIGAKNPMKF